METFKHLTDDEQLEYLGNAEKFISWYRKMNMEGHIKLSEYAQNSEYKKTLPSDFDAVTGIRHCMANIITNRQHKANKAKTECCYCPLDKEVIYCGCECHNNDYNKNLK